MTHEEITTQIDQITDIVEGLFGLHKTETELLKRIMESVQGGQTQLYALESRLNTLETVVAHPRKVTFK